MKNIRILAILFSIIVTCITIPIWFYPESERIVNIPLLLIIISLSFIFILKTPTIIKEFKEKKYQDILFLIIVFISLFIPFSNISQEFASDYEERILAKFPKKITLHIGQDINNWFNDRFLGRDFLISFYNNLVVLVSGDLVKFPTVHFYKSNGWLFSNNSYHGKKSYSQQDLKNISQNIKTLNNFCNKNNIKLYIMVVPSKENIYQDKDKVNHFKTSKNKAVLGIKEVKRQTNFNILYPEKELLNLKNQNKYVFFKTDTHPTDEAAYVLYKLFLNSIKQDFPELKITKLSKFKKFRSKLVRAGSNREDFDFGAYYRFIHINDKNLLNTPYTYYDYKNIHKISITDDALNQTITNPDGKYKLFILGDSFQENLSFFLLSNFYKIEKWRGNSIELEPQRDTHLDMNAFAPIIQKFNPDAILIILHQDNMDWLIDMYPSRRKK